MPPPPTGAQTTRERSPRKYVFGAAAGFGCHTVAKHRSTGRRKYDGPFGPLLLELTPTPLTASASGPMRDLTATRSGAAPTGAAHPVHPYTCSRHASRIETWSLTCARCPINARRRPRRSGPDVREFSSRWLATSRDRVPASRRRLGVRAGSTCTRGVALRRVPHARHDDGVDIPASWPATRRQGTGNSAVPNITPDRETARELDRGADYRPRNGDKPDGDVAAADDGGHRGLCGRLQRPDQGRPAGDRQIPEEHSAIKKRSIGQPLPPDGTPRARARSARGGDERTTPVHCSEWLWRLVIGIGAGCGPGKSMQAGAATLWGRQRLIICRAPLGGYPGKARPATSKGSR